MLLLRKKIVRKWLKAITPCDYIEKTIWYFLGLPIWSYEVEMIEENFR